VESDEGINEADLLVDREFVEFMKARQASEDDIIDGYGA
jgi:hypothetical protein